MTYAVNLIRNGLFICNLSKHHFKDFAENGQI